MKKKKWKMEKYIELKIKKRFSDLPFHKCEKCKGFEFSFTSISTSPYLRSRVHIVFNHDEFYQSLTEWYSYYCAEIICHSGSNFYTRAGCNINSRNYGDLKGKQTNKIQIQKLINYKKEISNLLEELCYKMYFTDELILLQKQYYTFLLCNSLTRKFPKDIAKIIANKILFFLTQKN